MSRVRLQSQEIRLGQRATSSLRLSKKPTSSSDDDNMIPLINIVFLLLVFFMVAGQITAQEPTSFTPPTTTQEKPVNPESVDIVLGADGSLWFMAQPVTVDILATRLAASQASGVITADSPVLIKADGQLPAVELDPIIAALKQQGFRQIALVTELAE